MKRKLYTGLYEYKTIGRNEFDRLHKTHRFKREWIEYNPEFYKDKSYLMIRRVKQWVAYTTI
jgi:hypothetical protein